MNLTPREKDKLLIAMAARKHFQAKWAPVRFKKMRQ